jgi:hypothetical protein
MDDGLARWAGKLRRNRKGQDVPPELPEAQEPPTLPEAQEPPELPEAQEEP